MAYIAMHQTRAEFKFLLRIIIAGAILFTPKPTLSQSTLQFNQVRLLSITANGTNPSGCCQTITQVVTVPAGKVWKIEAVSMKKYNSLSNPGYMYGFATGEGMDIADIVLYRCTSNTYPAFPEPPVWLPAGTYNWVLHYDNSLNYVYMGNLSVIEFNVVP